MKIVYFFLLMAGCDDVFGLKHIELSTDASALVDGGDSDVLDARDVRDAVAVDATSVVDGCTGCDVVAQTGCCAASDACYPRPGADYCAMPGAGVEGAACTLNEDCVKGSFCAPVAGSGVCYRVCDCAAAPGVTCQPPVCGTQQCRQYTIDFGYCDQ